MLADKIDLEPHFFDQKRRSVYLGHLQCAFSIIWIQSYTISYHTSMSVTAPLHPRCINRLPWRCHMSANLLCPFTNPNWFKMINVSKCLKTPKILWKLLQRRTIVPTHCIKWIKIYHVYGWSQFFRVPSMTRYSNYHTFIVRFAKLTLQLLALEY